MANARSVPTIGTVLAFVPSPISVVNRLDFPVEPIASCVAQGRELARRGRDIRLTYGRAFSTIGYWFDGRVHQPVDYALWLSPAFVSRWYGWLAEKGKWPPDLLQQRWNTARRKLDGHLSAVVVLCAYPRLDLFGYGTAKKADPGRLRPQFSVTIDALPRSGSVGPIFPGDHARQWTANMSSFSTGPFFGDSIWQGQSYDWRALSMRQFYADTPLAVLFSPDGLPEVPDPLVPLGDCWSQEWLVQVPLVGCPAIWKRITFGVELPKGSRSASIRAE